MPASPNKRRHPRVPVKLLATLLPGPDAENIAVEVGNFAPGGIFVKAANPLLPGSIIEVSFRMIANRVCKAKGRVAWNGDAGFGIAFDDTNEDMDRFTAQLLELSPHLHRFYLADVLDPELQVMND